MAAPWAARLNLPVCPLMDGPAVLLPRLRFKLDRGTRDKEHAMSHGLNTAIAAIGTLRFAGDLLPVCKPVNLALANSNAWKRSPARPIISPPKVRSIRGIRRDWWA
jgi:hypothetical protein